MKKLIVILLLITSIFGATHYIYKSAKEKDITYSVEKYMTSNLFNKHKMYNIDNFNLIFSDGNMAVVKVYGTTKKSPHKKVCYNVFLDKNNKGSWKVKKVYKNTNSDSKSYYENKK
ncbi:hypothetical protein FDF74_08260 [Clostridium niameyense]|uniref:DUF4878 domain-containing protein n=1 Tax=Clostridium niameyense TaxID=1622073 RepID=A0A6M0RAB9_9CLOT|nr:hypothetical protein [Clostridium niameyense]NEZ47201.1 hypothetical protein [Clostridium niameyense]